jgi:recombinational DNA repair protein RecR
LIKQLKDAGSNDDRVEKGTTVCGQTFVLTGALRNSPGMKPEAHHVTRRESLLLRFKENEKVLAARTRVEK